MLHSPAPLLSSKVSSVEDQKNWGTFALTYTARERGLVSSYIRGVGSQGGKGVDP